MYVCTAVKLVLEKLAKEYCSNNMCGNKVTMYVERPSLVFCTEMVSAEIQVVVVPDAHTRSIMHTA